MADFNPEEIKQEPLGNPEPNLEPHTSNLSVSQASNSSRSRDRDRPRKVLRSERRVFIINLPFNESWQNLRDWIVEKTGADEPYITFINDPISNKFTGACHIEFKTLEEADKCAAMSTEEFKGRSLIINKDENNSHLKVWCRKKNYTFEMDARFKPVIKTLDGRQAAPTESSHGRRGKPDGFSRGGPPSGHPPPQMPPMAPAVPLGYDPFGKPLINDVTDLLASCVFFMNLPWKVTKDELMQLFGHCGAVHDIRLMYEDENDPNPNKAGKFKGMGICEFKRTRDAHRAIIMMNNSMLHDREMRVKIASDLRRLPGELSELGRPLPEQQCFDICSQEGYDPYTKLDLFVSNLPQDGISEDEILDIFQMVGDAYEVKMLRDKDDRSRILNRCVVRVRTALDCVQCRNVLNDAKIRGNTLNVKLDKLGQNGAHVNRVNAPAMGQVRSEPPMASGFNNPPPNLGGPAPIDTQDAKIKELASLIGIDESTLAAIRQLKQGQAQVQQQQNVPLDRHGNPRTVNARSSSVRYDNDRQDRAPPGRDQPDSGFGRMPVRQEPDNSGFGRIPIRQEPDNSGFGRLTLNKEPDNSGFGNFRDRGDNNRDRHGRVKEEANSSGGYYGDGNYSSRYRDNNRDRDRSPHRNHNSSNNDRDRSNQNSSGFGTFNGGNAGHQQSNPSHHSQHSQNSYSNPVSSQNNYNHSNSGGGNNYNQNTGPVAGHSQNSFQQNTFKQEARDQGNSGTNAYGYRSESQPQNSNLNSASNISSWNAQTNDTIYLRNLPSNMTEQQLRFMIEQCGRVSFMDFPLKPDQTPVGYAYVRFDGPNTLESAKQAVSKYDNYITGGHKLECGLY